MDNLIFRRNGELKRQEEKIRERIINQTTFLREAAKSSFNTLSYRFEIDFSMEHNSTKIYKIGYTEREERYPLVAIGHAIFYDSPKKSETILSDFSLKDWNFNIYMGGYSKSKDNWKTGSYNWMLPGNRLNNFNEFEAAFKKTFQCDINHPIDYLIIEGEDTLSQQPIYIEFGKIPNPKKPFLKRALDSGKEVIRPFINPLSQLKKYSMIEEIRIS